ncbi:(deoxy)nucleoside triphosphate pyrophosphohydrolase [Nocardiopsis sp. CT-R113]|uniref:8-oxo-dGTP diphosphatase n=1 Tax=Nocardiopsis codii TaxID=3065942 RepID=A0ABU7K8R1_9ACTN|nr:(deoxy)nucleoside triphosphate pyrophosphohydrolase [Nocardiopsis sp. CT-R113]MEE2038612.1 (deoxy)nucleoside triphosphate pyrophosphohydrolase [Nocardiopsis sp. CT-R113]
MEQQTLVVVGAVVIRDGRVLAAQRADPPTLRGRWEFPGGKVDPGESSADAVVRECEEELGVTVRALHRIGGDASFPAPGRSHTRPAVLRLWRVELLDGEPEALEHLSLRWLTADDLRTLAWLPADVPFLDQIAPLLAPGTATHP